MIGLWAEVWNAGYTARIANSDLLLSRGTVNRVLDGPGSVTIETPILHMDYTSRALNVLTQKRVVEIWYQESEAIPKVLKAAFVIDKVSYKAEGGGIRFSARGVDVMGLLSNTTTDLARIYDNETVVNVITALLGLAGWTATFDGVSGSITTRFDGGSVLNAVQAVAEQMGYHFRLGSTFKTLEFGAFGDDSGYRVAKLEGDKPLPARDGSVIPLGSLSIDEVGGEIVNYIIPMGGGKGDSTLTLEHSTRTTPYTIFSYTGPDGRSIYYLKDAGSIASFGQIEARVNFKKVTPVGTSDAQIEQSANFLYDAAVEWLSRIVDPLTELTAHVLQQRFEFAVGDKVRVEYVEMVNVGGSPIVIKSIDALYWVMDVRESYGEQGENGVLTLTNIDRVATGEGRIIVGQGDAIEVQDVGYQPSLNMYVWGPYQEPMDSSHNAVVSFRIPDQSLDLFFVEMRVTTVPFSSTAKSPAHYHKMFDTTSSGGSTFPGGGSNPSSLPWRVYTARESGLSDSTIVLLNGSDEDIYTRGSGGAQVYGIYKDTDYPDDIDITVNGESVATGLDSGGAGLTGHSIDITDEIKNKVGGFRANHTITVSCGGGQGEVQIQLIVQDAIIMGKA